MFCIENSNMLCQEQEPMKIACDGTTKQISNSQKRINPLRKFSEL